MNDIGDLKIDPYKSQAGAEPWHSLSEFAMVRSFFYPDRSPFDPPMNRNSELYRDYSGRSINPFIPPTFADRDAAFKASRGHASGEDYDVNCFSYFGNPPKAPQTDKASLLEQYTPENPKHCRKKALDIFYRVEAKGSLPHAVTATAQLTAAILHEERMYQKFKSFDYDYVTQLSIEATYSSTLSKFVTGLVDRDIKLDTKEEKAKSRSGSRKRKADDTNSGDQLDNETPSRVSNSMLSNAAQIGLPASFVELRHDITHGTMPRVPEMKLMAFRALDWLWDNFWLKIDVGGDEWGIEERERQKYIDETTPEWIQKQNAEDHQSKRQRKGLAGGELVGKDDSPQGE